MVKFYDPIESKELEYHIDPGLLIKWNKLKDGRLTKKDEDRVYLVDGRERTGKSVFTFQQAKYIDPTFNIKRVCFTPEEFLRCIRTATKGQVIVFDEAFRGLSSKASQSKVNKKIVQAMMEMGQRNLIIFIVLPTFFLLEMYPAVLRSNALFHVFKDRKSNIRKFRIYNYNQKSILYQVGRKKGFSYSFPRVKARGKFFNTYAIDETSYRKKKELSFLDVEIEKEVDNTRNQRRLDLLIVKSFERLLTYEKNYTKAAHARWLTSIGIPLSRPAVSKKFTELKKNEEKDKKLNKIMNIQRKSNYYDENHMKSNGEDSELNGESMENDGFIKETAIN